ncbi:MAG: multidrug transporter AcrB, partial [Gammaproteobacteria bacterium HGW-Gammaproteobacteria-7]
MPGHGRTIGIILLAVALIACLIATALLITQAATHETTVTGAILGILIAAVVFVPYLGAKLLPDLAKLHAAKHGGSAEGRDPYSTPFYKRVRGMVEWCVRRRKTVILLTIGLFVASILLFRFVPQQFFPASGRLELMVDLKLEEGASLAATEAQAKRLEQLLRDHEGIDNFVAYVGTGSPRFYLPLDQQLPAASVAQFVVLAKSIEEREKIRLWLIGLLHDEFPTLRTRVSRLENGPPVGYPVQFRVSGDDLEQLRKTASQVADVMRQDPEISNVNFDWRELSKTINLEID